jgi:hypothetical protein
LIGQRQRETFSEETEVKMISEEIGRKKLGKRTVLEQV